MRWTHVTTALFTLTAGFEARADPPVTVKVAPENAPGDPLGASSRDVNVQTEVHVNVGNVSTQQAEAAGTAQPAGTAAPTGTAEAQVPCSWWDVPNGIGAGEWLMTGRMGRFKGFGLEYMATDVVGLHFNLGFDGLDLDDDEGPDFETYYIPLDPNSKQLRSADGGRGLADLGLSFHVLPKNQWDFYVLAGASYVGYRVQFDGQEIYGGSAYARLGSGLRFHWNRFSTGFEVGWMPYEFLRHVDGQGIVGVSAEDRFDPSRVTYTWSLGFRF